MLHLRERQDDGIPRLGPLVTLLPARGLLFLGVHAVIATGLLLAGEANPWFLAGHWWPITGTLVNLVSLGVLSGLLRREGISYGSVVSGGGGAAPGAIVPVAVILVSAGVTAVSVVLFARVFMAGFQSAVTILINPLPLWGAVLGGVGFPITLAVVELPFYYGYLMPRLAARGVPPGAALALCVAFHTAQYVALPFLPAVPYFLYRLLMPAPFAVVVGSALLWRPRLMPFLMGAQGALNAAAGVMLLLQAK
ncbi:MAG: hypothetical protein ACLFO1_04970 [Spirochaetaceae bacterium]